VKQHGVNQTDGQTLKQNTRKHS